MADKEARLLDVLVATYDSVGAAETDLMAVRDMYQALGTSYNFDASVVSKNERGDPKIHRTYEAGTRHGALKGYGLGLAAGIVAAAFPAAGIVAALSAGAAGAAFGSIVGHLQTGIHREDLVRIAERVDASRAALLVVCETNLAAEVSRKISAANRLISRVKDFKAEAMAEG